MHLLKLYSNYITHIWLKSRRIYNPLWLFFKQIHTTSWLLFTPITNRRAKKCRGLEPCPSPSLRVLPSALRRRDSAPFPSFRPFSPSRPFFPLPSSQFPLRLKSPYPLKYSLVFASPSFSATFGSQPNNSFASVISGLRLLGSSDARISFHFFLF